jgi:hypothetical protein
VIGLLVSAILAHAVAYVPIVEDEPKAPAQAWFIEDRERGVWCAFTDRPSVDAYAKGIDPYAVDSEDHSNFGWIRYNNGFLESITYLHQSEDAIAEDRYRFDNQFKLVSLKRTGHYIAAPWATFTYRPNREGRLTLDPSSKRVVSRLNAAGDQTYITDWPTFRRIEDLPFYHLIDFARSRVSVKSRCVPVSSDKSRG